MSSTSDVSLAISISLALCVVASPVVNAQDIPTADHEVLDALLKGRVDVTPERIIHVAPLPGDDGDGSSANPRRDLIAVVAEATPGTAIHLAPGVYKMSDIRDTFSYSSSRLITRTAGEAGRPIVLRTDPERYNDDSIAILDFDYENRGDWSDAAIVAARSYWVFERFELRRVHRRGFAAWGDHNTYRELHLHHANTDGSDNDALIVMGTSGRTADNVVVRNHVHHVGNIDIATDELIDRGGVNGGCSYSVTRLTYDSGTPADGHDASVAEWEAEILPPDSDVYVVGNHIHDCHYGLGLKNQSRGPYHFLSNYIHDVDYGVFSPFRETQIRNNIIHNATYGINMGRNQTSAPLRDYLKSTGNGAHSQISYNTVFDSEIGMSFFAGWGTHAHHNLIVDTDEPIKIQPVGFTWAEGGGGWPGIRGEYLLEDLSPSHPFWDDMPGYAREAADNNYRRMRLTNNCYTAEPVIQRGDNVPDRGDITGKTFDEEYRILDPAQRATLFVDEQAGDFTRINTDFDCGVGMMPATDPLPDADAGQSADAGLSPDVGTAPDIGTRSDTGISDGGTVNLSNSSEGCGCSSGSDALPPTLLLVLVIIFGIRRRAPQTN